MHMGEARPGPSKPRIHGQLLVRGRWQGRECALFVCPLKPLFWTAEGKANGLMLSRVDNIVITDAQLLCSAVQQ